MPSAITDVQRGAAYMINGGKVMLVAGASSGIGAALARHFVADGHSVSQPPRVDVNEVLLRPIDQHR